MPVKEDNKLKELSSEWESSRLDISKDYSKGTIIIKVGESIIGTFGNFSAIIGKAKSRKTFNLTAIVASAISGKRILEYDVNLPEGKKKVLYIDTEQSPYHCAKVMRRILKTAGMSEKKMPSILECHCLRRYTTDQRIAMLDYAMKSPGEIGLVVIDGLRDLVVDINNGMEATSIISRLMSWTESNNLHLITILHQNKSDDNARGHIGTELINKAETIIQIEKDKSDDEISKVEPVQMREKEFKPFAFRINDESIPEIVDEFEFKSAEAKKIFDPFNDISSEVHAKALEMIFSAKEKYGYEEFFRALQTIYKELGITLGHHKTVNLIVSLKENRMVLQDVNRKYYPAQMTFQFPSEKNQTKNEEK